MRYNKFILLLTFYCFMVSSLQAQWTSAGTLTSQTSTENDLLLGGESMTGHGSKCFWKSEKQAFRGGNLAFVHSSFWDVDSLGLSSFAYGLNTRAAGVGSVSFGVTSQASGYSSAAFGTASKALGNYSTAFGHLTKSSGNNSTAFGSESKAIGGLSTSFGSHTTASGVVSTSFGSFTEALGDYATAFGRNSIASGDYSTSFGFGAEASGENSTAFGYESEAIGELSTAFGFETVASADISTAFGIETTASGYNSTAFGIGTTASGFNSIAFGSFTEAFGPRSTAFGINTDAEGIWSMALGSYSKAVGTRSIVIGHDVNATGIESMVIGSAPASNPLINDINRSLMVGFGSIVPTFFVGPAPNETGTGNVSIGGNTSPLQKLHVNGAIEIGNTAINTNGAIRYNGNNFQGYHVGGWKNLDDISLWNKTGNTAYYTDGKVAIGTTTPSAAPPSEGLAVTGNAGIGTNNPTQKLEVVGGIKIGDTNSDIDGSIRYDGNNFQGHHAGEWKNLDETNGSSLWSQTGNTAYYTDGKVAIGTTTPSAGVTIGNTAAPPSEGLAVTGDAGIGTNNPAQKLEVVGGIKIGTTTSNIDGSIRYDGDNFQGHTDGNWVNLDNKVWNLNGGQAFYTSGDVGIGTNNPIHNLHVEGDIAVTGSIITPSDRRLKEDIKPIADALTIVSSLQPKSYLYKEEQVDAYGLSDKQQYGLIAQELEEILPTLITQQAIVTEDGKSYKGVEYAQLIPILTQAIKELNEELVDVKEEKVKSDVMINKLQSELKSTTEIMRDRLDALEKNVVKK